jgi:hypothetical protein
VVLFFHPPNASSFVQRKMQRSGSSWFATINTGSDRIAGGGRLAYYVMATDANAVPKKTRVPKTGTAGVTVQVCQNTPPEITLASSNASTISRDPSGNGTCTAPQRATITARATDSDEVAKMILHFDGPGIGETTRRMLLSSPDWRATISPADDGISGPGTLVWWVEAVDYPGLSSVSARHSIQVIDCGAPPPPPPPSCCSTIDSVPRIAAATDIPIDTRYAGDWLTPVLLSASGFGTLALPAVRRRRRWRRR